MTMFNSFVKESGYEFVSKMVSSFCFSQSTPFNFLDFTISTVEVANDVSIFSMNGTVALFG